jgi:hypothetical protein
MRLLVPNLVVPGHVVSELRGVRFSGFPFEWDMAYNNLPCTNVQAVMQMEVKKSIGDVISGLTRPLSGRNRLCAIFGSKKSAQSVETV